MLCDNPKCRHHVPMGSLTQPYTQYFDYFNISGVNKERTRVYRHLYRTGTGQPLFLCDACHSAVQLISKG